MQRQRLAAFIMAAVTTVTTITTCIPASASELQTFTGDGTGEIEVSSELDSKYTVKLPALITLEKNTQSNEIKNAYTAGYQVAVKGNIASHEYVNVVPDTTDFVLADAAGKRNVTPSLYATKVAWSAEDLDEAGEDTFSESGSMIDATINKAGKYGGNVVYNFWLGEEAEENHFESDDQKFDVNPRGAVSARVKINMDTNDGSDILSSKYLRTGQTIRTLPRPQREKYNFDGWFTEKVGGIRVPEDALVDDYDKSTLYAHWLKQKIGTLKINDNSENVTKIVVDGIEYSVNSTIPVGENSRITLYHPTVYGGTALYWSLAYGNTSYFSNTAAVSFIVPQNASGNGILYLDCSGVGPYYHRVLPNWSDSKGWARNISLIAGE